MPTYAIGDIQGCVRPLERLLNHIRFDPAQDRMWFVGDLVNRGPHSVEVLRLVKGLGDRAVTVLGNHDLHLLAAAEGCRPPMPGDTLQSVLDAPDREELLAWLRTRPLIHMEGAFALVHAGLLPQWSPTQAKALAEEVELTLKSGNYWTLCRKKTGSPPRVWSNTLSGFARLAVITSALTRMRICSASGDMDLGFSGPRADVPPGYYPWFAVPSRQSANVTIVCGHWAALGLHMENHVLALDSGCVWGKTLTAFRLEDRKVFQVPCEQ